MYEPSSTRRVRDIDLKYLKSLKAKAIAYPTLHVAPLMANIDQQITEFDSESLDKYKYEMIGGNHSREVFQSLIEEPIYRLQKSYLYRLAAVYRGLTDKEALALGKQHNLTAETHLQSKFRDDVKLTRRLFT